MDEKLRDQNTLIRAKINCTINEQSGEEEDEDQKVYNLSMLKNQKPNEEQKQRDFR